MSDFIYFSSSHATIITPVMTLTETPMGWMSSAGKAFNTEPTKHHDLCVTKVT